MELKRVAGCALLGGWAGGYQAACESSENARLTPSDVKSLSYCERLSPERQRKIGSTVRTRRRLSTSLSASVMSLRYAESGCFRCMMRTRFLSKEYGMTTAAFGRDATAALRPSAQVEHSMLDRQ